MTLDEVRTTLTARQVAVLRLVGAGMRQDEIAETLHITVRTVQTHLDQIRGKLEVPTTAAAAVLATRAGLL